ncbi:hypothetical protein D770_02325 [Flammeovirgaceae bacterium 311]|nr:hypothetical protein D770_02325 [Flammeovirgaceae bacterium 311]
MYNNNYSPKIIKVMLINVARITFLLLYLIVVSQGIFYLFAAGKALSGVSIDAYAEIRNSTDQVIEWRLKFIYPATLLVGLIAVVLSSMKAPGSLTFITTAIAFVCLVVDLALAVKFNMPINAQFHTYQAGMQGIDWESLRSTWLQFLEYRGVVQVVGFLALLVGMFK